MLEHLDIWTRLAQENPQCIPMLETSIKSSSYRWVDTMDCDYDEVDDLVSLCKIAIGRSKDLTAALVGFVEGKELLVAALFTNRDVALGYGYYAFDLCVHPKVRRQGLAKRLIDYAMDDFSDLQEVQPDLTMELDVVNPHLLSLAARYGLEVVNKTPNHTYLKKTSTVKNARRLQDIMGGTSIFGLKKSISDRIERKFKSWGWTPYAAMVTFPGAKEVRLLLSLTPAHPLSNAQVQNCAIELVKDLESALGYRKLTGFGFYTEMTNSAMIQLVQKV